MSKGDYCTFCNLVFILITRLITRVNLIAGLKNGQLGENIVLVFFLNEKLKKEKN